LAERFLGLNAPGAALEVALHAGTLAAVLVYYRRRIRAMLAELATGRGAGRTEAAAILAGTLPAVAVYAAGRNALEGLFDNAPAVAWLLCVSGLMLITVRWSRGGDRPVTVGRGVVIGAAQACAVLPGISRSGATIAAARHLGLAPRAAAEFSLLLSVPALLGAIALKAGELASGDLGDVTGAALAAGVGVAAAVGYAAIAWLVRALARRRFWMFGLYCLAAGIVSAVLLAIGR